MNYDLYLERQLREHQVTDDADEEAYEKWCKRLSPEEESLLDRLEADGLSTKLKSGKNGKELMMMPPEKRPQWLSKDRPPIRYYKKGKLARLIAKIKKIFSPQKVSWHENVH